MARAASVTGDLWRYAATLLPEDLDGLARSTGAIRRPRKFKEAEQLVRACLLYAHTGSLRTAAELARASGLVDLSAEGLFYRLKNSESFLSALLVHLVGRCSQTAVGFRLLVVDATTVCGPGSTCTDWRIHVGYDPLRGVPCSVMASDRFVGESLALHALEPGQLVLADRGYGTARNVHEALQAKADFLVRVQSRQIRLLRPQDGRRVDWAELGALVPESGAVSFDLQLPVPPPGAPLGCWSPSSAIATHDVRLIGARNGKREIVWLPTNLPASRLGDAQACELYRARWQVELYFKRLKSLGDLDVANSREGPTAKAALLAKLVLLVLTNLLCHEERAFSPCGFGQEEPVEGVPRGPQENRLRAAPQDSIPQGALEPC